MLVIYFFMVASLYKHKKLKSMPLTPETEITINKKSNVLSFFSNCYLIV